MTISYVTGDLLESGETDIAHGCNCDGQMGAGIAGLIAKKWPIVREAYLNKCRSGTFVIGTAQPVYYADRKCVWNLGTQQHPGPDARLWAVLLSFANLFEQCAAFKIERVAIPRIGAGIGGLHWADVQRQIVSLFVLVPFAPNVVVYTLESEVNRSW